MSSNALFAFSMLFCCGQIYTSKTLYRIVSHCGHVLKALSMKLSSGQYSETFPTGGKTCSCELNVHDLTMIFENLNHFSIVHVIIVYGRRSTSRVIHDNIAL